MMTNTSVESNKSIFYNKFGEVIQILIDFESTGFLNPTLSLVHIVVLNHKTNKPKEKKLLKNKIQKHFKNLFANSKISVQLGYY